MTTISRREALGALGAIACCFSLPLAAQAPQKLQSWPLNAPRRTGIHDIAPAPDDHGNGVLGHGILLGIGC